jgi:hypothetical protein
LLILDFFQELISSNELNLCFRWLWTLDIMTLEKGSATKWSLFLFFPKEWYSNSSKMNRIAAATVKLQRHLMDKWYFLQFYFECSITNRYLRATVTVILCNTFPSILYLHDKGTLPTAFMVIKREIPSITNNTRSL